MHLLPRSLFGRLVLVLLIGLLFTQLLTTGILLRDRGHALYQTMRENVILRTVAIVRLLNSMDAPERQRVVAVLSEPEMRVSLHPAPSADPPETSGEQVASELVEGQLRNLLPRKPRVLVSIYDSATRAPFRPGMRHQEMMRGMGMMRGPWAFMHGAAVMARAFRIQIQLADGSWVHFERELPAGLFDWPARLLLVLGILLVSIVVLSLLAVRWVIRPLRTLADAADELGRDIHAAPLSAAGPSEVREAARAFNRMQQRLARYLTDRNRILTAVSHDLKTPITRLRLRSELLEDAELKRKFQRDLDDMEAMVGTTLNFMRGSDSREPQQPIDILALLESLQEDARDAGAEVSVEGRAQRPYTGRPLALKRCIGNLIDNATRYGQRARVRIADNEQKLTIEVTDDGPGIPEHELEHIFEPFYRLESSRSQHTGGTGLGLGIARNIARAHGGDLTLENQPRRGLTARLTLPR